ncbi:MAG TPA: CBS domain-containing protein [Acidobacteriota bacterium]|nr:CBS domain-containing protein [Acidobacteriota bacterium]
MYERKDRWSVGEWMTPNPDSIPPDYSVRHAFVKMRLEGYRHLLVVDNGHLLGIVTDRDLRRPDISDDVEGWHDYYNLDHDYAVRDIMTTDLVTLSPQDRLEKAVKFVLDNKFGSLPVLDKNDELIGILTTHDIIKALSEILQDFGDHLRK